MSASVFEPVRRAALRVARYVAVARWLGSTARKYAPLQVLLVPGLSAVSVGLKVAALMLVAWVLRHVSADQGIAQAAHDALARFGGILTMAGAITTLLVISGLAQYGAGKSAVIAYDRISIGLSEWLLREIDSLPRVYDRWRLVKNVDRRELGKVISADINRCGMAVRIVLSSGTNVLFLISGLAFFLVIAPTLFLGLLVLVGLVALIAYPLNLRGLNVARAFETALGNRGLKLMKGLDAALAWKRTPEGASAISETISAQTEFVRALTNRLLVVESFRLILTIVLALVIGAIIALVAEGVGTSFFDYDKLLLLFAAFRFTYQGLQGILLTLTQVSRFLPALQRAEQLHAVVTKLNGTVGAGAVQRSANAIASSVPFSWRIDAANSPERRGVLEPGRIHLVLERADAGPHVLYRMLNAIDTDRPRFAQMFVDGLIPLSLGGRNDGKDDQPALAGETDGWLASVLGAEGHEPADPSLIEASGPTRRQLAALLLAIEQQRANGAMMTVVEGELPLSLPASGLEAFLSRHKDRIILVSCTFSERLRTWGGDGWVLVSTGTAISYACRASELSEPSCWNDAHAVYDQRPEGMVAVTELDEIEA